MSLHPDIAAVLAGESEGCIVKGDCLALMADMPDGCVDAVVTDPPYGIGLAANPFRQRFTKQAWDDSPASSAQIAKMLLVSRAAIIWGGNYFDLPPTQRFLLWDKVQPEAFSSAMCEMAWTSLTGPAKMFKRHVVSFEKLHPTAKPVELMEWCLTFVPEAELILDPMCGSGTTCVAAKKLGRRWIGIEIDEKYAEIARRRVANTPRPLFTEPVEKKPDAPLFAEADA